MKKTRILSFMASAVATVALLTGCSTENDFENGKDGLASLELSSVSSSDMLTRAVIDGKEFPTDKGNIGLFLYAKEDASEKYGGGYANVQYSYDSDKKKWTASPSIKVGSTPGYLYGYYPYADNTDVKAITVKSSLNGDDVMYATKQTVTDATASQTSITMNHALARVSIKVINNGYTGKAELSKIKFSGAKIAQEGTLNALDGKITATNSDVTLDVPTANQTITATGSTYECLLVPSDAISTRQDLDLTLTIDGEDKTATLSGDNGVIIAQGTKSNITITLSNSGISVQTVSVEDWNVVEVGGYKVTVKLSEDAGIENDVYLKATTDGSSVTIKSLSALTDNRRTSCTCTPAGKATCTPSIDATTGICTFTITDVQDDITAEVGYLKCNATVEYDSDMGSVKLNGVAVASGSSVQILYGEEAKFTAEANTGYGFLKWTDSNGEDLSTDNPYTSSVTSNITLNAVFGYKISAEVKPAGAGTVTGAGTYLKGSSITLTAIAGGSGTEFVGWAKADSPGTIISKDNPYEFDVSQSASYVAVFKLKDALSGVFTVAADDQGNPKKKVQFSKGNLYYNGTTFNFEDNQYDTTPSSNGDRVENHISHFMWCKTPEKAMELRYDSNWNGETPFFAAKDFTVNGYSGWCTLSNGEWTYLLETRTGNRFAKAKINGMSGLLIFPDGYSLPSGYSSDGGAGMSKVNDKSAGFPSENFPDANNKIWPEMEADGVVFLPAAGYRNGGDGLYPASLGSVGLCGYYWSASPSGDNNAFVLNFDSNGVNPSRSDARSSAQSVRLVTESK